MGDIKVFPSYFKEQVSIQYQLPINTKHHVIVADDLGRVVHTLIDDKIGFFGNLNWEIPTDLKSGMYFFILYTEAEKYVTRGFRK